MIFSLLRDLKKRTKLNLKPLITFFSILFFLAGCAKSDQPLRYDLTAEEKGWMEDFFTGVMLQNQAIYTLCGSKPMTCITLYYYTEEEIQAYYDQMTEEDKKTAIPLEDYHLEQNWEKWEQLRSRFPMKTFQLYKEKTTPGSKYAHVYFVDSLKVIKTLSENYTVFKDIAGFDFDPLKEVYRLEKGSRFWKKVKKNAAAWGLLFGYGLKNSLVFYWKNWGMEEKCSAFSNCIEPYVSDDLSSGASNLKNLALPTFMSFFEKDAIIDKYKEERENIQKEYEGKDFLIYTLQKLSS